MVEKPGEDFPLQLNTGRLLWHWHTRTKTARAPELHDKAPKACVEIHEDDAKTLSIENGETVNVVSSRGFIKIPAKVGTEMKKGEVFVTFHYGGWEENQAANQLIMDIMDAVSNQPVLKHSLCRIEKLAVE